MANVGAADPENYVFRDVGGVVADALEVAADDDGVQCLLGVFGLLHHQLRKVGMSFVIHVVDAVVHLKNRFGDEGIGFEQGLNSGANHDAGGGAHGRDVDRQRHFFKASGCADAVGDVDALVADALEVGINLDDGKQEAEVDGHGLFHREQVVGGLVDEALGGVDGLLVVHDVLTETEVAAGVGVEHAVQRLLGKRGLREQAVFQVVELLMKMDARHGGVLILHEETQNALLKE